MKNCTTCFLGKMEECPAIIKKFGDKKCFAWCLNEKEWEKRMRATLDYQDIMETRGTVKKKQKSKEEKTKKIRAVLRKEQ